MQITVLPNNDICESILGLNDWITTQTQNLSQITKSTLVEVKKKNEMARFLATRQTKCYGQHGTKEATISADH